MDTTLTPTEIAQDLINQHDSDPKRVLRLYEVLSIMRGTGADFDQVLDSLDDWLTEKIWVPRLLEARARDPRMANYTYVEGDDEY